MTRLPLANAYWVQRERWLAGEYPGGATREETRTRLAALAALGIDAYLDLTVPGELPAYDSELAAGVVHVRKPIPDHGLPLEPEHMGEIIASIDELLGEGRRIYLHCRAGIGRTGTMVAAYRMAVSHFTAQQAIDEAKTFGLSDPAQIAFLQDFSRKLQAGEIPGFPR